MSHPLDQGYGVPTGMLASVGPSRDHNEQLRRLWNEMKEEIYYTETDPSQFKSQTLPLARIKKIMKSDEDVRMISAEAPVLFAKACELFILDLTQRAWQAAEESKRRTLQRSDVATAIQRVDVFDFLLDVVPLEEGEPGSEQGGTLTRSSPAPQATQAAAAQTATLSQHAAMTQQVQQHQPDDASAPRADSRLAADSHLADGELDATHPSFSEYLRPAEPSAKRQAQHGLPQTETADPGYAAAVRFPRY